MLWAGGDWLLVGGCWSVFTCTVGAGCGLVFWGCWAWGLVVFALARGGVGVGGPLVGVARNGAPVLRGLAALLSEGAGASWVCFAPFFGGGACVGWLM